MAEGDFPDVEGAMRDWLRAQAGVQAVVAQRVWFGIPDEPTFPLLVVSRAGGTDDSSDACIDRAFMRIDVWGDKRNKAQATTAKNAVRRALHAITGATALTASVVAYGAEVVADTYQPDPQTDQPRYVLTVDVTARAA